MDDVTYIAGQVNRGIAKALNIGYQVAIRQGADWVLTMDQDSRFAASQIYSLIQFLEENDSDKTIGIVAPSWQSNLADLPVQECESVISAGSMVRLSAYQEIEGYNDDLFIDEVDHEFCYRLRAEGYRILRMNDINLIHPLGELLTVRWSFIRMSSWNHNYIRKYYMTRNRLYMRRRFPESRVPYVRNIAIDFLRVLIIEDSKFKKIKYMWKGVVDGYRGVTGKLMERE